MVRTEISLASSGGVLVFVLRGTEYILIYKRNLHIQLLIAIRSLPPRSVLLVSLDWWFCNAAPNPRAGPAVAFGIGTVRGRIQFNGTNGEAPSMVFVIIKSCVC